MTPYDEDEDEDGSWTGGGRRPSRDQIDYEVQKTAAARIARTDEDAWAAARSTKQAATIKAEQADEIGRRLCGFKRVPRTLAIQRRVIKVEGLTERIGKLDSKTRLLLMGSDPGASGERQDESEGS